MLRSSLLVFLLAFAANAAAEGFDYNYFELGYGTLEIDDIDVDGDGFSLGGSYAINDNVHVFAAYENAGLDFGIDATTFGAGIGYNTELSPTVDMIARASYQWAEVDAAGFGSVDDNGFGLGLGLRFAASDALEVDVDVDYVDFGDGGDDTSFGVGGYYSFTDAFALGLSGSWSDDTSSYVLSGRFYFGRLERGFLSRRAVKQSSPRPIQGMNLCRVAHRGGYQWRRATV